MSVFIHQSALICAIGGNEEARQQSLAKPALPPSPLELCLSGETVTLPYRNIPSTPLDQAGRLYQLIDQLMSEFIQRVNLPLQTLNKTALMFGSTSYDLGQVLSNFKASSASVVEQLAPLNTIPTYIKDTYNIGGLDYSYNSACSSSANALHHAKLLLEYGIIDHAIVVGCELYNPATLGGFHGLQLLSTTDCQPFANPNGMVLGEALGAVLLSRHPDTNSANIELLSAHSSVDTHNITNTNQSGSAISSVMAKCLPPQQAVAAIKSCGVGTGNADDAELKGIDLCFKHKLPLLAFKPFIGNTLGASGVSELILLKELMAYETLPNNIFAGELALESLSNQSVLLNNFGFGGNNVCLLVKHHAA